MPQRRANVERLGTFSDGVFAVMITIIGPGIETPCTSDLLGSLTAMADCAELRGELHFHCNRLAESSSPTTLH
jgi:hypothetical protein